MIPAGRAGPRHGKSDSFVPNDSSPKTPGPGGVAI